MDYFKKIERSVTISADKRSTVDLQVDVWSQDLNVTKFILKLDTTDSAAIDLTNATVRVAMVYSQDGKDVKIEAAGIVEDVATQKIAYVMDDKLAGFEGLVIAGFYVTLNTGQRIDIQNVTFNMRKSLLDKDLEAAKESYYQTFDDIVADVQEEGETAKTQINQVLPDVQAEGEKVKTQINAVVSNVNGYADTQKQAIDNIVSDVQSVGDTAKADIKATLPTLQNQVSELDKEIKELSQTMINKYDLGTLKKYASNSSTVVSYVNNNQNYNIEMQGSSGDVFVSGILGKYGDLKNKKLELYILNDSGAFNINYYLSKGPDWAPVHFPKLVNIDVNSGQNKITIDISKIINNDPNYTNENNLHFIIGRNISSQINADFTFFICEIGAETVSFDNKMFNKADYSISAGVAEVAKVAEVAYDSAGKLDDRLTTLENSQFKNDKLMLNSFSGRDQYNNNHLEYSDINNNYSFKFNRTRGYIYVSGILGKYGDFKTKTIVLYLNSNKNIQLSAYLSKGADWNSMHYPKIVDIDVNSGFNTVEINISDLINNDANYVDTNNLFFGIRNQINDGINVEISFYLTEKLLNENRYTINYADFALNASGELENRLKNLENLANQKAKYITCWGDSLTAMGGWTTELANLSKLPVYNGGTGGENVKTIVARQGADAMVVNNLTIPTDTSPILIATKNQEISTMLGNKATPLLQGGAHVNPCYIGDIKGTLRWTGTNNADTNGTWTFSRESAGDEVAINRPTAIRTDFDINRNAPYLMVIFIGQNGGYDNVDDLVHWHKLMINHANADNVLILGLSSGTKEERKEYETKMKLEFGRYFISLREYLATPIYDGDTIISCYGLEDTGLTATQNDLTAIASGKVPPQLLIDSVHYTEITKKVIGRLIYKRAKELNIF